MNCILFLKVRVPFLSLVIQLVGLRLLQWWRTEVMRSNGVLTVLRTILIVASLDGLT